MDETDKDYLLDKAMISIASFAAASRMAKTKVKNLISQPGVGDMTTEQVLEYLTNFMEEESEKMFNLYDQSCNSLKKKISRDTTYIELIPEAPFNPEDREGTISTIRQIIDRNEEILHLIQVYDKNGFPKFITIDEFEEKYYEYWETVLRKSFNYNDEQIEIFKKGLTNECTTT
ncbi:MAG: hypothetical protein AABY15_00130 [Nanoarchaeota archaeon]